MSDEELVLGIKDPEGVETVPPTYSIMCLADYTEEGDEMDFRFQAVAPKEPNVMDWLSFLFLSRHKIDTLYTAGLERAIIGYLELRSDVGEEAAKADIESYLTARVAQDYEENNPLGLRNTTEEEE